MTCRAAWRHPAYPLEIFDMAGYTVPDASTGTVPAFPPVELGISPIVTFVTNIGPRQEVELVTGEPVFHVNVEFDIPPIRLPN